MQSNSVHRDWIIRRNITEKVLDDFGISTDEPITIPVLDAEGTFVFNKYRRSPLSDEGPKYWYDRGGKVTLYGMNHAKEYSRILITEGEIDALVAWSANVPAVTSTGGALSFQEEWADLFIGKDVTICFDADKAGAEGMVKALSILPQAKIMILPNKEGIKDICDYVAQGGDLNGLLATARKYESIEDVRQDMSARVATYGSILFHEAYIRAYEQRNVRDQRIARKHFSDDRVKNAKGYPITELMEFTRNKACCPFHNEKTASFQYYPESNNCYCFGGCGKRFDAIDIYMKQTGCSFKEAVSYLNRDTQ